MRRSIAGLLVGAICVFAAGSGWAFPGILQLASRSGFWANDFPDTAILLQHWYYYSADEMWDDGGDQIDINQTRINGSFTRLVRPWHFGADSQFQYVLEGIVPYYNISGEDDSATPADESFAVSGVGDPMIYTSLGWNNPSKTTHLQGALIVNFPFGDEDVSLTDNAYAVMPLVAIEQRLGNVWLDASAGYWANFEDLRDNGNRNNDYFEVNGVVTYRFAKAWIYLQADYTRYGESETDGKGNDDEGYNVMLAPAIGVAIRPAMTLDLKYGIDVDGESTMKGRSFNLRFLWVL